MKIALIENGIVANIIEAETLEEAQSIFPNAVELQSPGGIGSTYSAGVFSEPPAPQSVRKISRIDFMRRIPVAKRIGIRQSTDPVVVDFLAMLDVVEQVELDNSDTIAGKNYLVQQGLLTADEGAALIA